MLYRACEAFTDVDTVLSYPLCDLRVEDSAEIGEAIDAASDIVYTLTDGAITGTCTRTVRPVAVACSNPAFDREYGLDVIPMPVNLISINEVKIDGVVLVAGVDYVVLDGRMLGRRKRLSWPRSNDLNLDATEVGTSSIALSFGWLPDWLGVAATTEVAINLLSTDVGHRYLSGVTGGNVQGASVSIDRAAAAAAANGLPMLDRLIGVYAPHGGMPVGVYSADLDNGWRLVQVTTS